MVVFCYRAEPVGLQTIVYDIARNAVGEPIELKSLEQPDPEETAVKRPPLEALIRGFERGRAPF